MVSEIIEQDDTYLRIIWHWLVSFLKKAGNSDRFHGWYAVASVSILFGTTLLWSAMGARLQSNNADQLSDPYLFSNLATFRGAYFPGTHTFLLKWPIFWLVNLFGMTSTALSVATIAVAVLTIAALVLVLYKIDRRPLMLGTFCLAVSLALLLVPTQPYAGALLPVSMAMLTTRNIEYAFYILAIVLFARARHVKDLAFVAGILLLALLIASDKLFLSLSLGGAVLALIAYSSIRAWNLVQFTLRWIMGSVIAAVFGAALLTLVTALHVTHLVNDGAASPYSLSPDMHNIVLGLIYGVLGLFTNTGANPAYDNEIVRQLPQDLVHRVWSLSGPIYILTIVVTGYALFLTWQAVWREPRRQKRQKTPVASLLAIGLAWSTVVAFGAFILTNHDYAVDARYLTIGFFALAVAASVSLRGKVFKPQRILAIAFCLLVATGFAIGVSIHITNHQENAFTVLKGRNQSIANMLKQHKVSLLVGSYWRVLPIKSAMQGDLNVMPLGDCTTASASLTSGAWQPDLRRTSFAYLLTLGPTIAAFPNCSVQDVISAYGHPNAVQVVAGGLAKPTEVILFYDRGSDVPAKATTTPSAANSAILPVALNSLASSQCIGSTIMNVVAHQDDDLLFLSPDLPNEIHAGNCVRTVFLTAGNDGQGRSYWISRQLGSEAAYSEMIGSKSVWVQKTVELAKNEYVTVATPQDNQKISLIFFNLPDGNLTGQGFPLSRFQSLEKLRSGVISSIQSVDGQSSYSSTDLISALVKLMQLYNPTAIHTQANQKSTPYPDHSDHIAAGEYTQNAAIIYDQKEFGSSASIPVSFYVGYPIHGYASNITGEGLTEKENAFFAYAGHDLSVCRTLNACEAMTYKFYLSREYQAQF